MFQLKAQLYDRDGNPCNEDLKELVEHHDLEGEYLNEHMRWDADFIEKITITSVEDNTINIHIKHTNTIDELEQYLKDFIENDAPYHDYLMLFYEDDDGYQCALSIDEVKRL